MSRNGVLATAGKLRKPCSEEKKKGRWRRYCSFGDRLLGEVGPAQEEMEQLAISHDALKQPVLDGCLAFHFEDGPVNSLDQVGEVDAGGADRLARLAVEAGFYNGTGIFTSVVEIGEDEPDRPNVDMTIVVPADELVNGADIGAGAAAHTPQGLGKQRVASQRQAAVIQENDVHFLAAIRRGGAWCGAGDPGHVGRDELAGGVARQRLENAQGALEVGHQFVKADQRHMDARQRGHQTSVALIGDECDRSRLSDGKIGPADAHVGFEEHLAEFPPGHFDHAVDVVGVLMPAR